MKYVHTFATDRHQREADITLLFQYIWENHSTFNSASLLLCIKNKLKERYEQFWEQRMESDEKMSKLRTYKLVKNKFGIEKYLELNERNLRKSLAAFRISAHKLNIELGKYLNLKVEDVMFVWLFKMKYMLYVNVKSFPYYENKCIKQFLRQM